jgi:hypothetical protein
VALGDEAFFRRLSHKAHGDEHEQPSLRQLKRRPEFAVVAEVVERMKGERWDQFPNRHADWGRDMVLFLARHYCGMTLKELGEQAGLMHSCSLTKAIQRFHARLKEDPQLAGLLAQANSQLSKCPDLTPTIHTDHSCAILSCLCPRQTRGSGPRKLFEDPSETECF